MDDKNIIIILLVIIVVILACLLGSMLLPSLNAKQDCQLTITSDANLHEGDNLTVKLTDMNGAPISKQSVNVAIIDSKGTKTLKHTATDSKGCAIFEMDMGAGNYTINCTFEGNDNYTGNTTTKKLTIEEVIEEPVVTQESTESYSSSSSSQEDYRPAVDSGGVTREEADYWGWEYTTEHGGHYIGSHDRWDEKAGMYHD